MSPSTIAIDTNFVPVARVADDVPFARVLIEDGLRLSRLQDVGCAKEAL